jgi:aminoglycoside phosphotransferase (APT) family kinase protein
VSVDATDPRTALVASICVAALGEAPLSIRPIADGGIVNTVFEVETQAAQLIFRIQFDRADLEGAFLKERWCLERARAVGVPGPEVVAVGIHGSHAYAIHTRVHGVVGSRYTGDVAHVWREIGRYARRFHRVEARGFGEHLGGPLGEAPDTSLAGWVDGWDELLFSTPLLINRGLLSAAAFDAARARLAQIRCWSGVPRLCHGNLSLDNAIVDERGRVSIIDWGTAAGHLAPELDLAELHAWSIDPRPRSLTPFLEGYGLSTGECESMQETLEVLQLWRVLSGAWWMLANDRARLGVLDFLCAKLAALLASE